GKNGAQLNAACEPRGLSEASAVRELIAREFQDLGGAIFEDSDNLAGRSGVSDQSGDPGRGERSVEMRALGILEREDEKAFAVSGKQAITCTQKRRRSGPDFHC